MNTVCSIQHYIHIFHSLSFGHHNIYKETTEPELMMDSNQFQKVKTNLPIKSIPTNSSGFLTLIGISSGAWVFILLNVWHRWHDII